MEGTAKGENMTKIALIIPRKDDEIVELEHFLTQEHADIYIFPEGFLRQEHLQEALQIIKKYDRFVITGLKEQEDEKRYESALIVDGGEVVGKYRKCILTKSEKEKGKQAGDKIHCMDTRFGKIGVPICYEIHFPEVARVMALENPILLVNIIGTGMWHEQQYEQWTALARARAIENEVFVVGCSHYTDGIPLAFAYSPKGQQLAGAKGERGCVSVEISLEESMQKEHRYMEDRVPACFETLSRNTEIY